MMIFLRRDLTARRNADDIVMMTVSYWRNDDDDINMSNRRIPSWRNNIEARVCVRADDIVDASANIHFYWRNVAMPCCVPRRLPCWVPATFPTHTRRALPTALPAWRAATPLPHVPPAPVRRHRLFSILMTRLVMTPHACITSCFVNMLVTTDAAGGNAYHRK